MSTGYHWGEGIDWEGIRQPSMVLEMFYVLTWVTEIHQIVNL